MTLELTQPEVCTLRDALKTTIECAEEDLSEMTFNNEDPNERANQTAYIEEMRGIMAKLNAALLG
jgi:hypothetical protein